MKNTKENVAKYALKQLGINSKHNGYDFLVDAVVNVISKPDLIFDLPKLYKSVADKNGVKVEARVMSDIRNTIAWAAKSGKIENMNSLYGFEIFKSTYTPRSAEFIRLVAEFYNLKLYAA